MASSPAITDTQQTVFHPRRGKIVTMAVMGVAFWFLVAFLAWMPFGVAPELPDWRMLVMMAALCAFIASLGMWMLLLANRLRQAIMEADEHGLHLFVNGYEWWLWNPWNIREARLRWDEIQAVQYRVLPGVGEPLPQYIIHTAQGRFLLSSFVWPDIEAMASLICQRTGLEPVSSMAELSSEVAQRAKSGRGEKLAVWAVRLFGWFCLIFGILIALAFGLIILTGQEFKGSLVGALVATVALISLGYSLRNFSVG
jgi:hypothetical protein